LGISFTNYKIFPKSFLHKYCFHSISTILAQFIKIKKLGGNTFGKLFSITTFGESHGEAIGVVIDGCPAGLKIDIDFINAEMARRRPGQSNITTERNEEDKITIISGVFGGVSTGVPLMILINNKDQRSQDYDSIKTVFRASHADFTYTSKYGIRDHRGGGRASARETAARVAAGAIAKLLLAHYGVSISAFVKQIGDVKMELGYESLDLSKTELSKVRCPDESSATKMESAILKAKESKDSLGGTIECIVKNCPVGLGEPVFDKLHADIGKGMLSINAVKGFEIGEGFHASSMKGSEHNDEFENIDGTIKTITNHSGGIQGGISNGMDIVFRVAFKPVSTISQAQQTVDENGIATTYTPEGRHDPCVVPRAVPIVEAMSALVLADHLLRNKTAKI
jgi:chorismate synthase